MAQEREGEAVGDMERRMDKNERGTRFHCSPIVCRYDVPCSPRGRACTARVTGYVSFCSLSALSSSSLS